MKWWGIVLFWVALIFGVYYLLSAEGARRASQPEVAGWDDIHECGSLTSFDGTKTLDFDRHRTASLTEKSSNEADKAERKTNGTWSFDDEKERYTVVFGDSSLEYVLVKPEDASVCILAPGDVGAVNLRESWFARIDNE
jgi:hypothetical protein